MTITILWTDGTTDAQRYESVDDALETLRFILTHSLGSATQSVTVS